MKNRTLLTNYSVYAFLFVLPFIVYHAIAGHEFLTAWDDGWMVFNRHTTDGLSITAVLFAVHPLNIEAVAWISASKVPLHTLFGLSALICYVRYVKTGKKGKYVMTFVLFVVSFLCKEQAIVIPIATLFIDWFAGRNFRNKTVWLEKIPFLLIVVLGGLYTLSLRNIGWIEHYVGYPVWQRLVFASYSITEYLTKLIISTNLMYVSPFPMAPGDSLPQRFLIYPVIFTALVGAAIYYRKYRVMVFGALFFLLNVSLTLHIISMSRITIVADTMKHLDVWGNNDTLKKDVRDLLEKRKIEEQKNVVPMDSISPLDTLPNRPLVETGRAPSLHVDGTFAYPV